MSVQTSVRSPGTSRGRAALAAVVITASVLALAGVTSIALGAAFPLAIGVIEQQDLSVSPADLALAERFAGMAWAFIVVGVAALAAAFIVPALFASRRPTGPG